MRLVKQSIIRKDNKIMISRQAVVNQARSWVGRNEKDGSFKLIVDIYNSHMPYARGTKMQYSWEWCACFCSAVDIALGYASVMPLEIGVGEMILLAMNAGIWQEADNYLPKPGDRIVYDWKDSGKLDNLGWPNHIGIIETVNVSSGYMTVIEGNKNSAVGVRTININGRYIRGFITPKYDDETASVPQVVGQPVTTIAREVIAGQWGAGSQRKAQLESAGYNYQEIQNEVNRILNTPIVPVPIPAAPAPVAPVLPIPNASNSIKKVVASCSARKLNTGYARSYITTANLYCRDDAGTNKMALCQIPKGTVVNCYGYYTPFNGSTWLYIQFTLGNTQYTGFSSKEFLK